MFSTGIGTRIPRWPSTQRICRSRPLPARGAELRLQVPTRTTELKSTSPGIPVQSPGRQHCSTSALTRHSSLPQPANPQMPPTGQGALLCPRPQDA